MVRSDIRPSFAAGLTLMLLTLAFNILGHVLKRKYRQAY
jgi:phosphate transport system permease protein